MGRNIVSVPQLYGTTYTLFGHIFPRMGVQVRFGKTDRSADLEALIDENTRAIFCETVGNPVGQHAFCDLEALADSGVPASHAADRQTTPWRRPDPGPARRLRRRRHRCIC